MLPRSPRLNQSSRLILRAEFYIAQDKFAEARDELEKAQSRFPEKRRDLVRSGQPLGIQKQFNEAQSLLDQAQKQLGDRVELRLQRAKLSVTKGGPQVVKDLNELGQNLEPFSKEDRRKLLNGLATELPAAAGSTRGQPPVVTIGGTGAQRSRATAQFTRSGVSDR